MCEMSGLMLIKFSECFEWNISVQNSTSKAIMFSSDSNSAFSKISRAGCEFVSMFTPSILSKNFANDLFKMYNELPRRNRT